MIPRVYPPTPFILSLSKGFFSFFDESNQKGRASTSSARTEFGE
jgi:hypothetical protein